MKLTRTVRRICATAVLSCLAFAGMSSVAGAVEPPLYTVGVKCFSNTMEAWYPDVWTSSQWPAPTSNGSYVDATMYHFKWSGGKWVFSGVAGTVRALVQADGHFSSYWTNLSTGGKVDKMSVYSPSKGYHRFTVYLAQKVWGYSGTLTSTYQWLVTDGRAFDCLYK